MATHRNHEKGRTYFLTFTCYKWLNLIHESNQYTAFNAFFETLKKLKMPLLGYVIMPNHFHALIHIPLKSRKTLNQVIANGKRFLAYDIVDGLEENNKLRLLSILSDGVQENERLIGKKHQIFRLSFDAKECRDEKQIEHYLDYIHANPVAKKWMLADDPVSYPYSSARFYYLNEANEYLTHYKFVEG